MDSNIPITAIGVMIVKGDTVLLGKRKTEPGIGTYAFPGGKLDIGESFEDCAIRETREEAGIKIKNPKIQFIANLTHFLPKHYTHIGIIAEYDSGVVVTCEPEKCEGWDWYPLSNLPTPLFEGVELTMEAYKNGYHYFDSSNWSRFN